MADVEEAAAEEADLKIYIWNSSKTTNQMQPINMATNYFLVGGGENA